MVRIKKWASFFGPKISVFALLVVVARGLYLARHLVILCILTNLPWQPRIFLSRWDRKWWQRQGPSCRRWPCTCVFEVGNSNIHCIYQLNSDHELITLVAKCLGLSTSIRIWPISRFPYRKRKQFVVNQSCRSMQISSWERILLATSCFSFRCWKTPFFYKWNDHQFVPLSWLS